MQDKDYLKIAHENLRDTIKYRAQNIDRSKILETDDYLLFTIGLNTDDGHLNGCLSFNDNMYRKIFDQAQDFFGKLGFSYSFWIRDGIDIKLEKLLKQKGFEPKRKPGSSIMITRNRIKDAPLPRGYSLKKVKTSKDMEDMARVIGQAFEKDREIIDKMFSSKKNLNSECVKSFLIYDENKKPVSAAISSIARDSSGIYYVSTLKEARSKGLGRAITKASTNIGFDLGKDLVILQASKLGEILYHKLGFEKIGSYRSYKIK